MFLFSKKENCNTVGVYDSKDLKVCIHCTTDIIIDQRLDIQHDGHWFLYCLTKKGSLYRVGRNHIEQFVRQSSSNVYDQTEIFSDLLGQQEDVGIQLHTSTQPVYVLNDSDIIGKKHENSVAVCVSSNHILVVAETSVEYTLFMYRKANINDDEAIAKLSRNISSERRDKEILKTLLVKVVTCDCIETSDTATSDVLTLDATLFKQLFGAETVLLNSPIILISQLDGSVYFIPMSSFVPSLNFESATLSLDNKGHMGNWKLLCQVSKSVTEITTVTLEKDDKQNFESPFSALCICGHDGQVMIFRSENGYPDYIVSEVFIYSPVLCLQSYNSRLYYSDGYSLFEGWLEVNTEKTHSTRSKHLQLSNTKVLNDKHVTQIHAVSADGYINSLASPCSIYCSCLNGQLNVIETSAVSDTNCDLMSNKESLKDILTSIDGIGTQRQQVNIQTKSQEEDLKQLGIASYLMAGFARKINEQQREENVEERSREKMVHKPDNLPVSVVLKPKGSDDNDVFEILVEITNQMAVTLSSDWTITASVVPTDGVGETSTTCVKVITEWKRNEKLVLSLSVSFQKVLSTCKLIVKAVVVTGNTGTIEGDKKDTTNKGHISVPIFQKDIDVIDCLLPVSETCFKNVDISKLTPKTDTVIKEQANNRMPKLNLSRINEGTGKITVSTRNVFKFAYSAFEGNGHERAAGDLLEVLLGRSVSDNTDVKPSDCQLVTVVGHAVHISLLPLELDRSDKQSDVDTVNKVVYAFEMMVRSCPSIVAAIHRAVRQREQQMVETFGKRFEPTISVQCARTAIQTAQDMLNHTSSSVQNETTISTAFQKLRNIQL